MTHEIQWVQLTIPSPSCALLAAACAHTQSTTTPSESEYNMLSDLRDFFSEAHARPHAFAPSGLMAHKLKIRARRADGVRRNDGTLKDGEPRQAGQKRRLNRHQRRLRAAKERRGNRAETAATYNATRDEGERAAIAAAEFISAMASDGQLPIVERSGILPGGSAGRPEGQDQAADDQG